MLEADPSRGRLAPMPAARDAALPCGHRPAARGHAESPRGTGRARAGPRGPRLRRKRACRAARSAMIGEDVFTVAPWSIPERELRLDLLDHTESVFALSN